MRNVQFGVSFIEISLFAGQEARVGPLCAVVCDNNLNPHHWYISVSNGIIYCRATIKLSSQNA